MISVLLAERISPFNVHHKPQMSSRCCSFPASHATERPRCAEGGAAPGTPLRERDGLPPSLCAAQPIPTAERLRGLKINSAAIQTSVSEVGGDFQREMKYKHFFFSTFRTHGHPH